MTLELKPLGNACNINCTYCYQDPMRKAGNTRTSNKYDLDLMMDIADKSNHAENGYTVFGGEGLLIPKRDLEKIFKRSFERYGRAAIQTNGTLLDDDHIEMFKKYNVALGLSFDGYGELNELRRSFSDEKTNELTNKTIEAMKKLIANRLGFGVIITIHKSNGTPERLPKIFDFLRWLGDMGVHSGAFHMLEVDSLEAAKHSLTAEENEYAFMEILDFLKRPENADLKYHPFIEMEFMMAGNNANASCVWNSCNATDTASVYGIEGNGQLSNCGMVNKEGIEWTKPDTGQVYFRDLILYNTPQEQGGCGGCEFFILCNGYCTGSAIDNDWRNRTVHCSTLKKMFKRYETDLEDAGVIPFSKHKDRRRLEEIYIDNLAHSLRLTIPELEKINNSSKILVEVKGGE